MHKTMNILFVNDAHISEQRGGVERVTSILSTKFAERGHLVYMLSANKPLEGDSLGANQYVLPTTCNEKEEEEYIKQLLSDKDINIIINQSESVRILSLISKSHRDIVIISCLHINPLAAVKSTSDYWDRWKLKYGILHFIFYPIFIHLLKKTRKAIVKSSRDRLLQLYITSDAVVLLSEKYINVLTNFLKIQDQEKIQAIPNPFSYEHINPREEKENVILFIGRLEFQKRLDRLMFIWKNICHKHPEWKILVLGDGEYRENYERLAKKLNLTNFEILGNKAPEKYYKEASIICMTSSHEGLPMVLLEATKYEVIPVVFNSFESVTDIIEDKFNGFLIEPFSNKEYARVLKILMENNDYRKTIRMNIRESNKKRDFSCKGIIDKWELLFNHLDRNKNNII